MTSFRIRLNDWFVSLSERDRRAVRLGGLASVVILIMATVFTVVTESRSAADRVVTKRLLLADLPTLQDRDQRLRRIGTEASLSLEMLVKRILNQHGIDATIEVQSTSSIRLRATAAAFDAVVETLGDLEASSISIRRATLTSNAAGRVDVEIELQKSGS